MNKIIICLFLFSLIACKHKKKDSAQDYFSVVNYIRGEVKQMDTAHHVYTKIETAGNISDTSTIPANDFRKYAADFLTMPDISTPDKQDDYEETNSFDEDLGTVLLTYTPKNDEQEIRRQTIMLEPTNNGDSRVQTILVNSIRTGKDSVVEKEMTWHAGRRFQVVTKTTKGNEPENIKTLVITWE